MVPAGKLELSKYPEGQGEKHQGQKESRVSLFGRSHPLAGNAVGVWEQLPNGADRGMLVGQ